MNVGLTLAVTDDRVRVVVDETSERARRELGQVAWSVLETLALDAQVDADGRWMTVANARSVAVRLGIGKDRAAAAQNVLRNAGVIVAHLGRQPAFRARPLPALHSRADEQHHDDRRRRPHGTRQPTTEPTLPVHEPASRSRDLNTTRSTSAHRCIGDAGHGPGNDRDEMEVIRSC